MGAPVRFRAILEPTPSGAFVALPDDVVAALGARGRTSVVASIDGEPYTGQVMPYTFEGGGRRVILGVTRTIRAKLGKAYGDELAIELTRDDRSRSGSVEVPVELADALASDDAAATAWDRLAPSHRREHAERVAEAKREQTRRRRAARVVELLGGGG